MATAQFVRPAQLKKPKQESITLKGSAALVGDYLRKNKGHVLSTRYPLKAILCRLCHKLHLVHERHISSGNV